ncbi:pseudoazurin [Rhizobium sp. SG_E_25_P2]|uniref:pseudoazurin n=1 Tax=Rhizobium sp. SG_E_25_P2 TaxID=2879942 RepID=UPI002476F0D4|nr:pseudoazurin [Rhizobium sp. SG_E_25_P2]MDH6268178.1 pseudoazurin [Rhizobium sp. SG_E_25_P2]
MTKTLLSLAATAVISLALAFAAQAADHEIHMLNKGKDGAMVFEPGGLKVVPGDTVTFVPTDKSHNAESVKDLIPAGAEAFKGKMNEAIKITFTVPGAYIVKCTPHFGMGMAAVVVVGDAPANLDAVKSAKLPKKARERVEKDLSALGL